MPCAHRHVRICQQALQQRPQCVWITDDLLAETWNRFARFCQANQSLAGGRRYGSNVPGPMEAHKRRSLRRLGMSATAIAPSVDPSVFLGLSLGGRTAVPPDNSWTWQPPEAVARGVEQTHSHGSVGHAVGPWWSSSPSVIWEPDLEEPEALPLHGETVETSAVGASKDAFEVLLRAAPRMEEVQEGHLEAILHFLRTPADEPTAHNLRRLCEWLADRSTSWNAYEALLRLVLQKTQLHTLEEEELPFILASLVAHGKERDTSLFVSILDSIAPVYNLTTVCVATTRLLLPPSGDVDLMTSHAANTLQWLRDLRQCENLNGWQCDDPTWRGIYDAIASAFPNPAPFAAQFLDLDEADWSRILLRHWIPHHVAQVQNSGPDIEPYVDIGEARMLRFYRPADVTSLSIDGLMREFDQIRHKRYDMRSSTSALVDLLVLLRKRRLPHVQLTRDIFSILTHSPEAAGVFAVYQQVRRHHIGVDPRMASDLVNYLVETGNLGWALYVFKGVPSLSLSSCSELLLKLAHSNLRSSAKALELLLRQPASDMLPRDQRPERWGPAGQVSSLTLTPEHVDLVHRVAFAFAGSTALGPRVAFRRVWNCYRFLKDREAPLSPLMSRAFFTAGILRYLDSAQGVPKTQRDYVLSIVGDIEGPGVADELRTVVSRIWKRQISLPLSAEQACNPVENTPSWIRKVLGARFKSKEWSRRSVDERRGWLINRAGTTEWAPAPPPRANRTAKSAALPRLKTSAPRVPDAESRWRSLR